jgi:hypothetical protein
MDESISSRDQQLQQNEPFDPLYQNIIPEINQVPLTFVPGKVYFKSKKGIIHPATFSFLPRLEIF